MNIDDMSLQELKALAKELGMKGFSAMKKQELVEAVSKKQEEAKAAAPAPAKPAAAKSAEAPVKPAAAKSAEAPAKPAAAKTTEAPAKPAAARPAQVPERPAHAVTDEVPRRPMAERPAAVRREAPPAAGEAAPQRSYDPAGSAGYRRLADGRTPENRMPENRMQDNRVRQTGNSFDGRPVQNRPYTARDSAPAAVSGRIVSTGRITSEEREALDPSISPDIEQLDSGETKTGILEVVDSGYGFIRCDNFLPGENDVYVSPAQIRKFNLKTGDIIVGNTKIKTPTEKFSALLYIKTINGFHPSEAQKRFRFEDMTPIFPHSRLHLETPGCTPAMRIVDLLSPIGKGQRGMIVSQPKAGKTTLLKQIASAWKTNYPDLHLIILLIDERPEEVTDMKESIQGPNVEVIYSTFDELPENHKRVSEMVIERAKRLVEHKKDVVVLLDSITRLARAYNLTVTASGRTLSGGLDPAALHMPKKFFGAARCMREGGSLTILATALVETGSRMDDVVFEEFKGTGNMELVLDRNLSERRIFPAIDLPRSSTRREDLLLSPDEIEANNIIRKAFNSSRSEDAVERIINMFSHTRNNREFIEVVKKTKL